MKLCRLATWAVVIGLTLPAWAAERQGKISGYVRDASGTPQMGAVVELLGSAHRTITVFSDGAGYYTVANLIPGLYTLRVTAPSFLPALREKIGVRPGVSLNVNVTLSTLLGVMQLGPVRNLPDDDDWKWTLRSVANRPILRVFDDVNGTPEPKQSHETTGTVSFLAGSVAGGYGTGSDMSTGFSLERSMFSDGHLALAGNVGYGAALPAAIVRTKYTRHLANGSTPSLGLTVRRFAPSDPNLHNAALQSLALSAGDDFSVGDVLELKFGSELQTIQFLGHLDAFRPYASADFHLSPNTVLEYSYTTSRPSLRSEKGFDSAPADMSEADPRVSVLGYAPQIESAHHQELSLSQRIGRNNLQVAFFSDRITNPALTGTGDVTASGGYLLPDISSGTFSYLGPALDTGGLRVVLQHKFSSDLAATLDYAYGGALDLSQPGTPLLSAQQWITTQRRHAVAAKFSGTIARTHTRWIASYRWVNGSTITPVDMFNASAGQSDPFLNVFIRQPLPCLGGHVEALIDVRNLLAQGYVPVLGQDHQTVYLVDSARSIRGGVAFNF
ncbi:MAG TPA: carboxypeptidase-like regulatory domain-containing protein [Candidatus Sulfotelmatobacter sp.]|nr:carboxypeptidase-like regulatory domain-containing protein [Candidatus Sulfotelmatobacter sp.]